MVAQNSKTPDWRPFLDHLVQELGAHGAGLWVVQEQEVRWGTSVGVSPLEVFDQQPDSPRRRQLLTTVLQSRQSCAVDTGAQDAPSMHGPATMLFAAVMMGENVAGAVEIVQRPELPVTQRQGQLQFLERLCRLTATKAEVAPRLPDAQETPSPPDLLDAAAPAAAPVDWPAVLNWIKLLQRGQRLKEVAGVIANEGRLLFHADRVSVAVPHGSRVRIVAVSGQDRVHQRSNLIQSMARFAKLIMATKEPFLFQGGLEEIPPSLEQPLAEFTQLGGARMALVVPLLAPQRFAAEPAEAESRMPAERVVQGALIIEQMEQSRPHPRLMAHLDLVRENLSTALHQARAQEAIFLLPLWTTLGRWRSELRGRRLAWVSLAVAGAVALTVALVIVPWEYRVDGQGKLMPAIQRDLFAPWDGQVLELLARGGERVSPGQPLLTLRNEDLEAEHVKTRAVLAEKRKLSVSLFAQIDDAERTAQREEETRLRGKAAETAIEIEGLTQRLALLKERLERLTVRSPIHGVVTTFQADQLLLQRPVQRGEVLLQVMDDHGAWRLELDVAEQRLGHILAAQSEHNSELPISFRLLTRPERAYQARLSEVGTRSVSSEARGSVVELRADVDVGEIERPAIGAQVRARIGCGRKPLGYCLLGDVIEFVQRYLWW